MRSLSLNTMTAIVSLMLMAQLNCFDEKGQPGWLNYNKNSPILTLENPESDILLEFKIPLSTVRASHISISPDGQWNCIYDIEDKYVGRLHVYSMGSEALIHFEPQQTSESQEIYFKVKSKKGETIYQQFYISSNKIRNVESFRPIEDERLCQSIGPHFQCFIEPTFTILIGGKAGLKQFPVSSIKGLSFNNFAEAESLARFRKNYNILDREGDSAPIANLVQDALTVTLSTVCSVPSDQFETEFFYGFCRKGNSKSQAQKIDTRYSFLVLEILFRYNEDIAVWLVESQLQLLEEKLYYSFNRQEWIELPEHIEIAEVYLKKIHTNPKYSEQARSLKLETVCKVLNGLVNNLMLSEVNHISEEINYRENNKVHPTLIKMLAQVWKHRDPKSQASSIYAESFTPDFYYHEADEKLESCVGKTMWLIKLLGQYSSILTKYGDSSKKQQLDQVLSLVKVLRGAALDDPRTQAGLFNSIILAEKLKIYSKSIGYESLLPYVYEVSSVFPASSFLNLTTETGIASLQIGHPNSNQEFDFRGNVNLYFNYKILFSALFKVFEKDKEFFSAISRLTNEVQRKIVLEYSEQAKEQVQFATSWNQKGEIAKSEKYLAVIHAAFLTDLSKMKEVFDQKNANSNAKSDQNAKMNEL